MPANEKAIADYVIRNRLSSGVSADSLNQYQRQYIESEVGKQLAVEKAQANSPSFVPDNGNFKAAPSQDEINQSRIMGGLDKQLGANLSQSLPFAGVGTAGFALGSTLLRAGAGASALVNMGGNAVTQYVTKRDISPFEVVASGVIGYASPAYGLIGNVVLNTGGAVVISATNNFIDGKGYNSREFAIDTAFGVAGSVLGYKLGAFANSVADSRLVTSPYATWVVNSAPLNKSATLTTTRGLNAQYSTGAIVQGGASYLAEREKNSPNSESDKRR
ncbi:MAG: hypothetical protein IPO00_02820 [Betaproteobacteria bacterium]|nr:hypothetical protein [Betaproteobacteria bacterium]